MKTYIALSKLVLAIASTQRLSTNRNTSKRYEICSKLTIKPPEQRQWILSGFFIDNFEHILHLFSSVSIVYLE